VWPARTLHWFLDLIFPPVCPVCESLIDRRDKDRVICPACRKAIRFVQPPLCPRCGLPYPSGRAHLCAVCLKDRRYFAVHRTAALYEGALKEMIHRFKYQGVFPLKQVLGDLLEPVLKGMRRELRVDLLVPVPLHIRRLRERGFNQALLLVKELSTRSGIPYQERALAKIKETPEQISLKKRERAKNLKGVFTVTDEGAIKGKRVVLVDDVFTTGATVNECSRALLKAGAKQVAVLTVARAL
jgi:ComF family protein